jgi:hypothetical protein
MNVLRYVSTDSVTRPSAKSSSNFHPQSGLQDACAKKQCTIHGKKDGRDYTRKYFKVRALIYVKVLYLKLEFLSLLLLPG